MREKQVNGLNRLDRWLPQWKSWLMEFSKTRVGRVAAAGLVLAVVCAVFPIHNRPLEVGMVVGVGMAWVGVLVLLVGHWKLRVLVFFAPLLGVLPFILPGKPIDPAALRADYVARLRSYDGTHYLWGGESPLGIDCSGLPRRALRDALWAEGWRHRNGAAFRKWLAQWWFDSSALAMGQGYRGLTREVGLAGPLWELDRAAILPGDLAVRGDGGHVVVYLGDHRWIEADPNLGKVHTWVSTSNDGGWYSEMVVNRWVDCE